MVDVDALRPHFPVLLRGCTPGQGCHVSRVPAHGNVGLTSTAFPYTPTSERRLVVPLRLTVRHGTQVLAQGTVQVPVEQDYVPGCGNYGGLGRVTVTADGTFIASQNPVH